MTVTQRILPLALIVSSVALGVLCAWTIQSVTFGGYVFELGLALAGGAFATGVRMALTRY